MTGPIEVLDTPRHECHRCGAMCQDKVIHLGAEEVAQVRQQAADLGLSATPPVQGSLAGQVEALERRLLKSALAAEGGNKSRAAERLGLSRQGLLNKLGRYEIG